MKTDKQFETKHNYNLSDGFLSDIIESLSGSESYSGVYKRGSHDIPMPSISDLKEVVDLFRSILFPGYFIHSDMRTETMKYYIGSTLDKVYRMITEQIKRGFCFGCTIKGECNECEVKSRKAGAELIANLPSLRRLLTLDASAAYTGDPAANNIGETIFCYPSLRVLTNHRIAHELYKLDIPLIPRIISEMAHSETGIDIHPGACIGENFFIDHGTGTVIGETSIIGNNVRIYQGVTLGAKSFPRDDSGNPIKGNPRHPIVEDDVIIYSGATILGRITIGKGAEIGGNVWITSDVPPGAVITQNKPSQVLFQDGSGI
jgi:serine O-acetyltransferase